LENHLKQEERRSGRKQAQLDAVKEQQGSLWESLGKKQHNVDSLGSNLRGVKDALAGVVKSSGKDEQILKPLHPIQQVKPLIVCTAKYQRTCLETVGNEKGNASNDQEEANSKTSTLEAQNASLRDDKTRLQSDLAEKAVCSEANGSLSRLQEKFIQLGLEKTGVHSELYLAESSLQLSESRNQELGCELQQLKQDKADVDAQLRMAKGEKSWLKDDAQELMTRHTNVDSDLAQEKARLLNRDAEKQHWRDRSRREML
jgi:chromosome segregation ATPase